MISDAVSLSDKLGCFVRTLVAEERALDALLLVFAVLGAAPNKGRVSSLGSQNDLVPRPDDKV